MRTLTKQDCRALVSAVKPSQLGSNGKEVYSRLFQEAYGVPFDMFMLLRKGPMSIAGLEKKLKMSRRTVFRYLLAVEKTGCKLDLTDKGYQITKVSPSLKSLVR